MKVCYKTKKLAALAANEKKQVKELGAMRAKIFVKRILSMTSAEDLDELRLMPGRFHELRNNRSGQWACDLDQPYRLVFEPKYENKADGKLSCIEVVDLEVIEICNYHE